MDGPDTGYIAARAEAVARQLNPCDGLRGFSASGLADTQFGALMLCPPSGRGIATESRSAMESLPVAVSLDTLCPTSIETIEEHLSRRKGHNHLLRLDGWLCSPAAASPVTGLAVDGGFTAQ